MARSLSIPPDYAKTLEEIRKRVRAAQYDALKAVNMELVALYWDIGGLIAQRQKDLGWGKSVVEMLSRDLRREFPGMSGFSVQNLWYMRQFFPAYTGKSKLQPLVGEISWSKHLIILGRCKDDLAREFYIRMTGKFGWTKDVLALRIEDQTYEETLLGQKVGMMKRKVGKPNLLPTVSRLSGSNEKRSAPRTGRKPSPLGPNA